MKYKKTIIGFLIVTVPIFFIGCYSTEVVTISQYNRMAKEDKPKTIQVITKDGQQYSFSDSKFYIADDTLYGEKVVVINDKWIPFIGKISFDEVKEIEFYDENNWNYQFSISEYEQIENEGKKPDEIFLVTADSLKYYFLKDNYYLEFDTLYGRGKLLSEVNGEEFKKNIALSNIELIEYQYFSSYKLIFWVVGFLAFAFLFIAFSLAS